MFIDSYSWTKTTIESVAPVAKNSVVVTLKKPMSYTYKAGQYAVVRANDIVRQYSFCSAPQESTLQLLVQREPSGVLSNWFHDQAKPGDKLELSQAFGSFVAPHTCHKLVFIAGRIGIAPFVSMLRSGAKARVVYAVREPDEICFPELMQKADATLLASSQGQRLTSELLSPNDTPDTLYYICGSKRFVDAAMTLLQKQQVPEKNIRRELFTLE